MNKIKYSKAPSGTTDHPHNHIYFSQMNFNSHVSLHDGVFINILT